MLVKRRPANYNIYFGNVQFAKAKKRYSEVLANLLYFFFISGQQLKTLLYVFKYRTNQSNKSQTLIFLCFLFIVLLCAS